ncbi:MAG TPA: peptidoglycan bridge formation glycyltransferase FemA/FemB family protein [Ktedonobacterales bacterium]|nr:peptidoglycan bridge formation glycyltransferase FemA/FemB family protein [Ktedonobacterales bacterium]
MAKQSSISLTSQLDNTTEPAQLQILGADQRVLWDTFVSAAPYGHILQSWGWGELKAAFGWRALRVVLWDDDHRRILAGAQVLFRALPFTPLSIAYLPKGPVLDWSNPALCQRFFRLLHPLLRARHVALLRIDPDLPESISVPAAEDAEEGEPASGNASDAASVEASFGGLYSVAEGELVAQQLRSLGFRAVEDSIQPRRTIAIDLTPDERTIALRQKPKWRYNAGLAVRKGVTVRVASSQDDVQRWYELMRITSQRDAFAVHTLDYYFYAWKVFGEANQARLLLAEHEGKLLAGIFVSLLGREGIYLYGASGNEGRHLMPNHLLQWEAMRWAKAQGATLYDLWGVAETEDPNDPMAGVYRFKRGWGGKMIRYIGSFDYVYSPLAYRGITWARDLLKQVAAVRARRQKETGEVAHADKR